MIREPANAATLDGYFARAKNAASDARACLETVRKGPYCDEALFIEEDARGRLVVVLRPMQKELVLSVSENGAVLVYREGEWVKYLRRLAAPMVEMLRSCHAQRYTPIDDEHVNYPWESL